MTSERDRRELDEEVNIARVQSAIEGDTGTVAAMDAMGKAQQFIEQGKLSPLAYWLCGTIARARVEGKTLEETHQEYVRLHDGNADMAAAWDRCIEELRGLNLL